MTARSTSGRGAALARAGRSSGDRAGAGAPADQDPGAVVRWCGGATMWPAVRGQGAG